MEQDNRCTVPWDGRARILLHKNMISACCKTPAAFIDPVSGVLTPEIIQLRKDILENKRSPQCASCWKTDDIGGPSQRRVHSTHFSKTVDWEQFDVYQPIENIEVVFSNKCQMMCVYCAPHISSMWEDYEFKITGKRIVNSNSISKLEDVVNVSKLKEILITGGEPLLDEACIQFIQNLPVNLDRKFTIITNLSYGDAVFNTLLSLIEKHKNLIVGCSLDSIGENINRKYLNLDKWKKNFEVLVDNVQERQSLLGIMITVTSLNYKDVQGVIEYIIGFRRNGKKRIGFQINPISLDQRLSLASSRLDHNFSIKLSDDDSVFLTLREKEMIESFNHMISNVQYNAELDKRSSVYLQNYLRY